jgi:hypothetical protein
MEHTVVIGITESHTEEDNGIVGIGLEMIKSWRYDAGRSIEKAPYVLR